MNGELNAENLEIELTPEGFLLVPKVYTWLQNEGYTVERIKETHSVQSEDSETAHIVAKIETYEKPKDHPKLDYVADRVDLWLCDCWHYRSECFPDIRDGERPSDAKPCKHVTSVSKSEKAQSDENQATLDNPVRK